MPGHLPVRGVESEPGLWPTRCDLPEACNVTSLAARMFAMAASVAALGTLEPPAAAQPPASGDPYARRLVVTTAPSPYWGYTYNPYASYLHGVAAVTEAQGDLLIKREQAGLVREEVRQARLKTRRLQIEQVEWERDLRAGAPERERERVRKADVERSVNDPPLTEIWKGSSLNRLLDDLCMRPVLSRDGSTPVQPEWLAHVNTTVDGNGSVGLLKGEQIFWPQLLFLPEFAGDREQLEKLLARAREQALSGAGVMDPRLLRDLRERVAACEKRLRRGNRTADWTPRHYTDALHFVEDLDRAVAALERPDPAFLFSPLQGKTVAELVVHMRDKGIRFAPATNGQEASYRALHRALANEVTRLQGPERGAKNP
jgi:hypothetical protein